MTKEEFEKFQMLTEEEQFEITQKWSGNDCAEYWIQQNDGNFYTFEEMMMFAKDNLKEIYGINDNI